MLNNKDLYIYKEIVPITDEQSKLAIGVSINRYEIKKYIDVQNLTETDCYIVDCTQRIVIPNETIYNPAPTPLSPENQYNNYPALLTNQITINSSNDEIANYYLLQYSPKTLNTTVMTDSSMSDSSGLSYSQQHTSGSTISQTNSYGISGNIGTFGEDLTSGFSASFDHSNTVSKENSNTSGKTTSQDVQKANSDSMSMKDWGSYAIIDGNNQTPTWVWGQEYPWNVLQFKTIDSNGNVILPNWIKQRLFDGTQLYPPTQLSLFGIDFVSKASWLVQMYNRVTASNLVFTHTINYCTASHMMSGTPPNGTVTATMTKLSAPITFNSSPLDLAQLALDAISNSAATGFIESHFTVVPSTNSFFEIVSRSNNLLVRGRGFSKTMFADFTANTVSLDVYFKITDNDVYTLFLKCWKTADANCILTITINGDSNNTIVKNVNDLEFNGGEDNMVAVILRNRNYTAADYYDYLQFGMNHISIVITSDPKDINGNKGFQLRTLAIG